MIGQLAGPDVPLGVSCWVRLLVSGAALVLRSEPLNDATMCIDHEDGA